MICGLVFCGGYEDSGLPLTELNADRTCCSVFSLFFIFVSKHIKLNGVVLSYDQNWQMKLLL